MKPEIKFRAMMPPDYEDFTRETSYVPGPQFGGIVAWSWDGRKNTVMGAVGMDGWTPASVMLHWWIRQPRCLIPLAHEVQRYLHHHGKRKVFAMAAASNVRCVRMIFNRLGFTEVARLKDGWAEGIDIVISERPVDAELRLSQGVN